MYSHWTEGVAAFSAQGKGSMLVSKPLFSTFESLHRFDGFPHPPRRGLTPVTVSAIIEL
jgi:hypothetical protein